jgi:hypothetical protein
MRDVGDPLTTSQAIGAQLIAKALPPQRFHLATPGLIRTEQPYHVTHLGAGSRLGTSRRGVESCVRYKRR